MRRLAVVGGAILIFVIIGFGFVRPLMKGQPPLPPAPSCPKQFGEWYDQVTPLIVRLSKAHAENDAAGERTAARMLWVIIPPVCKTSPWLWHHTLRNIVDHRPLGPRQRKQLLSITSIDW